MKGQQTLADSTQHWLILNYCKNRKVKVEHVSTRLWFSECSQHLYNSGVVWIRIPSFNKVKDICSCNCQWNLRWPWRSCLIHKALIPNDLIPNILIHDRPNTWYTIRNTQHWTYLMPKTHCTTVTIPNNAASMQPQYSVRITGGLVTNTHHVRDLIPNT